MNPAATEFSSNSEEPKTSEVKINEIIVGPEEKHAFKAETSRLLEIVANSLYSEKEVFIRELTSNAADACEKLKYFQLFKPDELDAAGPAGSGIHISVDKEKGLFVIQDYGIGMQKSELEENLGTIALSGAGKFLKQVAENSKSNTASKNSIIGQFGVGFYSAFTVGSLIEVYSRSAFKNSRGYCWRSDGLGEFTLAEAENVEIGTKLVVHLKPDEIKYSDSTHVDNIIKKYSNFVGFPVFLNSQQINTIQPLWTMDKSSISDAQYDEFYKFISDSFESPQYRLHYSTDSPVQIRSLLFIPKILPNLAFQTPDSTEGKISLYSKRVLIKGKTNELLPPWLSFIHGIVESEDIPLNLSRELLQNNLLLQKIKRVLTARILKWLQEEQRTDPTTYAQFYRRASNYIKSGILSDAQESRKDLMNLLMFESSFGEDNQLCCIKDYVSKMKEGQKEIYICLAKSRQTALASPYFEPFKKKGIPVLFSYESMDEFLIGALDTSEGYKFTRIEDAKLDLDQAESPSESSLSKEQEHALSSWFSTLLGDKIKSVKMSNRSMTQPVLIVDHAMHSMTLKYFKQMMAAQTASTGMPQDESSMKMFQNPPVDLEMNPHHPMIQNLVVLKDSDAELAKEIALQLFDNALIQAGLMEEAQPMVSRLNHLLTTLVSKLK
jgi:TNF receptor-associated protein 1